MSDDDDEDEEDVDEDVDVDGVGEETGAMSDREIMRRRAALQNDFDDDEEVR